ncbi:MAG: hypothetical protein KGQ51_11475 [Planctomycetes bacterium]|nr:hypothetical protein [Planctomycetota bacterium]
MSMLQRTIRLFVLGTALMAGHLGMADSGYHPFSEPVRFDPDWQFFAPSYLQDVEDLTARQRAPHGLFFSYDRVYTGVTRPENSQRNYVLDGTWGNRWDFGWMNDRESGWYFSTQQITGPNVYNGYQQLRLNGVTTDDELDLADPFFPTVFGNDPYTRQRTFDIRDSVNVGDYNNFEANKTWRIEPYRYGGMTEWLLGVRYSKFEDLARNDTYTTFLIPDPADPTQTIGEGETYTNHLVWCRNDMLLGQLGFRYFKHMNQFMLSTEFKAFAGHTFQSRDYTRIVQTATYEDPPAIGDQPVSDGDFTGTTTVRTKNNATPVGFDLRAEGSYRAFRYLDLRAGFQLIYFGQGIWRGATPISGQRQFDNDQQLVMPGVTFGFAINR